MSKFKFKVGDRVRCISEICYGNNKLKNKLGTVIAEGKVTNNLQVRFDELIGGYEDGRNWWVNPIDLEPIGKFKVEDYVVCNTDIFCTIDKGWVGKVVKLLPDNEVRVEGLHRTVQCDTEYFDLYTKDQPTKIVITTDGKTTTAKMYRDKTVIGVQTTKCHPDDRFDFKEGARIAFDRLVGEGKEEPKYYNGKVVCVDKKGLDQMYTTGKIYQFVDGVLTADDGFKSGQFESFEQWKVVSRAEWLEVVE